MRSKAATWQEEVVRGDGEMMRQGTMGDGDSVQCARCHTDVTGRAELVGRDVCPECGSSQRIFHQHLSGALKAYSALELRQKRQGTGRPLVEIRQGTRPGRDGIVVTILRVIDRVRQRYRERVLNEDGTILIDKNEDLTSHR